MRPIKFRCWNVQERRMENILKLAMYLDGKVFVDQDDWRDHPKQFILMQFTGLHDSTGNEIFESDILDTGNNIYFVEYKWDRFWLSKYVSKEISKEGCGDGYYRICLAAYCKDSKVIGNIHENGDLLQETTELLDK